MRDGRRTMSGCLAAFCLTVYMSIDPSTGFVKVLGEHDNLATMGTEERTHSGLR